MPTPRAVVLVEGNSDRVALHTLAKRHGRDLDAEGIEVVAMGGITNTRTFASRYGPHGLGVPLTGLYDAPEEAKLRHGLAAAGLGDWTRAAVLRRFVGVRSGRKARYAALLVEALEPGRVPEPLAALLARVRGPRPNRWSTHR